MDTATSRLEPERIVAHRQWVTGRRRWPLACSLLLLSGLVAMPAADTVSDEARSHERVLSNAQERLTQYRAYRRMHGRSERFDQEAWIEVWTELDARGFRYEVVTERGSEYMRNKVLKEILKREQQLIASGEAARSDLSASNYDFRDADVHGPGVRYVLIKPKRKDVLLVDGRMVLNQDGSELLRVEGRLARNPSFWTSLVNVIRSYARLDGVRVPISTETIAKVKFAGLSHLQVHYEYESINGRPVSLAARQTLIAAAAGR
jgi:hypothetical protein